jgi:hypothetical protein
VSECVSVGVWVGACGCVCVCVCRWCDVLYGTRNTEEAGMHDGEQGERKNAYMARLGNTVKSRGTARKEERETQAAKVAATWWCCSSECYVSQHLNKGTLETMARQIQRRHSEMVAMEELAKKELEEVSELCPSLHFMPE